jgi:cell fate (sporulation/competence/biofilm development) regulator YlbF (YheA/YmcA/DUF963 family)
MGEMTNEQTEQLEAAINELPRHSFAKEAFKEITDVFSGSDGGLTFIKLKLFLEEMEMRHDNGDYDAGKILQMMIRFHSLITYVKSN